MNDATRPRTVSAFSFRPFKSGLLPLLLPILCFCLATGCASAPKVPPPQGACVRPRHNPSVEPRPTEWLGLMVAQHTGAPGVQSQDCTGRVVRWVQSPESCIIARPALGTPEPTPVTGDSVIERRIPNGRRLIWVITHRFADGTGYGPIALIQPTPKHLVVEAIGHMRLGTARVQLEYAEVGDGHLVIATGSLCPEGTEPTQAGRCQIASQVLVHVDDRLEARDIHDRRGHCVQPPWFEERQTTDKPLPNGWSRHFELHSSLTPTPRYLIVTEQVSVDDRNLSTPDAAPREVRRIDAERFVHLHKGRLTSRQPPLWPKILPAHGELDHLVPQD